MSDYDREFMAYIETLGEPDPIISQARVVQLKAELRALNRVDDPDPFANPPPTWVPDPIPAVMDDKPKAPRPHDPFRTFAKDHRRMGPE
jgi:hypothetical protein